jgi:HK97 family phage portal protein
MSFIKKLFSPTNIKQQTHTQYNELVFKNFLRALNIPDVQDKKSLIEKGYQTNSTVYSIVDYICKAASNVPVKVYEITDSTVAKEYKALISGTMNETAMIKANSLRNKGLKPAPDSELANLMRNPNPDMGYAQWMIELMGFFQLTGDGWIQGVKPRGGANEGKIRGLYVLPSQYMEIVVGNNMNKPIDGYSLNLYGSNKKDLDYEDVGHIKTFNPDFSTSGAHLYGQSPLTAAYRNLTINNDAITTGSKYLKNQGVRGILASDDMSMLTQDQAAALKDRYGEQYTGADNAGNVMITNHAFKWINIGLPAADLALIEQYNLSKKDLAAAFGFPSLLLNDSADFSVSTYREAKKQFYLQKVIPDMCLIRDELNRWLTPTYGDKYYIDFDFMSVPELQEDLEKVVKQLNVAWWFTPNEKRIAMMSDRMEKDGMDDIYVPANLINLTDEAIAGELTGGDPMNRLE